MVCVFFFFQKKSGARRGRERGREGKKERERESLSRNVLFLSSSGTFCLVDRHFIRHDLLFQKGVLKEEEEERRRKKKKKGVLVVLVDVFYHVLGALKGMPFSLFFLQTEHLPLQTQFKEREVGCLQHSVSNAVLLLGCAQVEPVATVLIKISSDVYEISFYSPLLSMHL